MTPGPRLLLVEDSAATARATARLLSDGVLGAEVALATDAGAAIDHLRADRVDLVVLDLTLPGRQGLELLADVRADRDLRALPVVVLSGTSDPAVVQRSYDLGANCFVRRPVRIAELVPAVRAIEQFWLRHVMLAAGGSPDEPVFKLPLAATADAVREARAMVRRLVDGWGLSPLVETAELCASELATNAVLHAGSPVLLVVALLPESVRVEVEDEAPGPLTPGPLGGDAESGRGLAIVDAMTECWGVDQHPAGKSVWFELRRPDVPSDGAP